MKTYLVQEPLSHELVYYNPGSTVVLSDEIASVLLADRVVKAIDADTPVDVDTLPVDVDTEADTVIEAEDTEVLPDPLPEAVKVNVNAANADALEALDGIGRKTAESIVLLRDTKPNKQIDSLDELREIPRVNWDAVLPQLALN